MKQLRLSEAARQALEDEVGGLNGSVANLEVLNAALKAQVAVVSSHASRPATARDRVTT